MSKKEKKKNMRRENWEQVGGYSIDSQKNIYKCPFMKFNRSEKNILRIMNTQET